MNILKKDAIPFTSSSYALVGVAIINDETTAAPTVISLIEVVNLSRKMLLVYFTTTCASFFIRNSIFFENGLCFTILTVLYERAVEINKALKKYNIFKKSKSFLIVIWINLNSNKNNEKFKNYGIFSKLQVFNSKLQLAPLKCNYNL